MIKQEKILKMDYKGEWKGNDSGEFEMYIINEKPLKDFNRPNARSIEGFIKDYLGISVFSGIISYTGVDFTKIYSRAAVKEAILKDKVALETTIYRGVSFGENFEGTYHEEGNSNNAGTFFLNKIKSSK